ncbi:MAG: hypothetical protein KC656_22265 [Myxococcales bacterium]|nr:hypothetical protein [Myxococcales bacterium]
MAFWNTLFKPTCPDCGEKITGEPVEVEGAKICKGCMKKRRRAEAERAAEIEARRVAEEEAYQAMMDRRRFGTDPRYDPERHEPDR